MLFCGLAQITALGNGFEHGCVYDDQHLGHLEMVEFHTVEEWEEYLKSKDIDYMAQRQARQITAAIDWKSTIVVVDYEGERQKFEDYFKWTKEHSKGKTTLLWPLQLEFELEDDAMLFRLIWG